MKKLMAVILLLLTLSLTEIRADDGQIPTGNRSCLPTDICQTSATGANNSDTESDNNNETYSENYFDSLIMIWKNLSLFKIFP